MTWLIRKTSNHIGKKLHFHFGILWHFDVDIYKIIILYKFNTKKCDKKPCLCIYVMRDKFRTQINMQSEVFLCEKDND